MTDTTNNQSDDGWTGDEGAAQIMDVLDDDILDDPVTDNGGEDVDDDAAESDKADAEGEDNSDPDDAEDEDEDAEDPEDDSDDEKPDGPARSRDEKGRFVSDEARVQLPDGSTATIAELKAGALRQGDYTRKTTEVAREKEQVQAANKRVSEREQQLDEQLAQVSYVLERFAPQVPQDPEQLEAYHAYKAQWDQLETGWKQELEKRQKAQQEEQGRAAQDRLQQEQNKLLAAMPQLADPVKRQAFFAQATKAAGEYGISDQDIQTISDHRFFLVLRDAMRYRRSQAEQPKVEKKIASAPKLNKGSRRANPKAGRRRTMRERTERLRRDGSVEAGVAALLDMDL